ncbi:MAG: type IV secretory system conjugative DNA transfer family protein [Lachnospiraceae bacterium]|nr:type IV secretory system conjugative DNA transfer family protein [Lachnospiraceae bacterium]
MGNWSSIFDIEGSLTENGSGALAYCNKGKRFACDSESNMVYLGSTGSGKSRRGTVPLTLSLFENMESGIIVDPKGELLRITKAFIPKGYYVKIFNFRELYNKKYTAWNPLSAPYELYRYGDLKSRELCHLMISEIARNKYPLPPDSKDPFWIQEARKVFIGAVYLLFLVAEPWEINLPSVYQMIAKGEEKLGASALINRLASFFPNDYNVSMHLESYINTAPETKGGIRSVMLDGLSDLVGSEAIRSFISNDTLDILSLKGDKPFLIYIILPDETDVYDELAGILVSQLSTHFVRLAEDEYGGKLPVRLNIVLEELGNIGGAISNLPKLLSAARSRNIRIAYVLQTLSQLKDVYGEAKASTILDNTDTRIIYRTNHLKTLNEISELCGVKKVVRDGEPSPSEVPLIMPDALAAMDVGQALVMLRGGIKFVTWLPDFIHLFSPGEMSGYQTRGEFSRPLELSSETDWQEPHIFDIKAFVQNRLKENAARAAQNQTARTEAAQTEAAQDQTASKGTKYIPTFEEWIAMQRKEKQSMQSGQSEARKAKDTDTDESVAELTRRIDKKIEELEKRED